MTNISHWRYQAVIKDGVVSICEVYIDENGKLDCWTDGEMGPKGEGYQELQEDIAAMAEDAANYEPVEYGSLVKGMTFNRQAGKNV